jgi:putative ABC transport system substrate-binding protein
VRRREFIRGLGGLTLAWPAEARAQQSGKPPVIGYLGANSEVVDRPLRTEFLRRLGELGWVEGRNVTIQFRWVDGLANRADEIAPEFVRLPADVIVTNGDAYVRAAMRATATIPIVFTSAGDPVGNGLVASLARPGGNVTGMSIYVPDTAGKRLELLREVVPGLRRLAILFNAASTLEPNAVQAAAHTFGLDIIRSEIRRAEDIAPAVESLNGRAEAIYVCTDPLLNSNSARISMSALAARLPVAFTFRDGVDAGGLVSYGPDRPDQFRRAAELVDKILRGTKPADIPVEQPTKFVLVVNLKTAKALGLTIPESFLTRADEVIE